MEASILTGFAFGMAGDNHAFPPLRPSVLTGWRDRLGRYSPRLPIANQEKSGAESRVVSRPERLTIRRAARTASAAVPPSDPPTETSPVASDHDQPPHTATDSEAMGRDPAR